MSKKSKSSLNILVWGPEISSALILLFLSDVSSSLHLVFLSGKNSSSPIFLFWDKLAALMERLSMWLPKELREVMGRLVMREERRDNWWPSLVKERLAFLDAVFGWLYNATGQQ